MNMSIILSRVVDDPWFVLRVWCVLVAKVQRHMLFIRSDFRAELTPSITFYAQIYAEVSAAESCQIVRR